MKFVRSFPRAAAPKSVLFTLVLLSCLWVSSLPVLANGNMKSGPRPTARLISTSVENQAPQRARQVTRLVPYSAVKTVVSPSATATAPILAASNQESRAFNLINAERRARGQKELVWDGELLRLARYHSNNMARRGFFNHHDPDGLDLRERAAMLGIRGWRKIGENIAYNTGYADPASFAVQRWMLSEKHRDNLLDGEYTHAALAVAVDSEGKFFFTQVFVRR